MNMKRFSLFTACFIFIQFSAVAQVSLWYPMIEMDKMLFPSYVIATHNWDYLKQANDPYYFGDSEGQFGVKVFPTQANTEVEIVIESPDIMRTSRLKRVLEKANTFYEMFPQIDYRFRDVLMVNKQPFPATLKFTMYVNGAIFDERTETIRVMSINDCPYILYARDSDIVLDQNFMFSAYVNETDPIIDEEILPAMLKSGIISNITGYQTGKQDEVMRQVFALWYVLQGRGIKYSDIAGRSYTEHVRSQYIRTIKESLTSGQANCVDGTVLMASVLYKIGLEPIIVGTPSHCYLGFFLDSEATPDRNLVFLETTLLNGDQVNKSTLTEEFANWITEMKDAAPPMFQLSFKYDNSVTQFAAALQIATSDFIEKQDKFGTGDPDWCIYPVSRYRREGLSPITRPN